jgi:hypothetical protein
MARIQSIHPRYRPLVTVALPLAPLTASPVPHLTSLYANVERGPYGRSSYPGVIGRLITGHRWALQNRQVNGLVNMPELWLHSA